MIVLWLWGGPSHMETFDLKPDAPASIAASSARSRPTSPASQICEHLPRLARMADKFALVRSLRPRQPGPRQQHAHRADRLPRRAIETPPFRPKYPDVFAVATRSWPAVARACRRTSRCPQHALQRRRPTSGPASTRSRVAGDPNRADFRVPGLLLDAAELRPRSTAADGLLAPFDRMRRTSTTRADRRGTGRLPAEGRWHPDRRAARKAFDLAREDPQLRDRYGRHVVGQRCLLARRLVEAGVRLVTVDFPCVPGQKAFSWDDHASVWNIFEQMKIRLPGAGPGGLGPDRGPLRPRPGPGRAARRDGGDVAHAAARATQGPARPRALAAPCRC